MSDSNRLTQLPKAVLSHPAQVWQALDDVLECPLLFSLCPAAHTTSRQHAGWQDTHDSPRQPTTAHDGPRRPTTAQKPLHTCSKEELAFLSSLAFLFFPSAPPARSSCTSAGPGASSAPGSCSAVGARPGPVFALTSLLRGIPPAPARCACARALCLRPRAVPVPARCACARALCLCPRAVLRATPVGVFLFRGAAVPPCDFTTSKTPKRRVSRDQFSVYCQPVPFSVSWEPLCSLGAIYF